MGRLISSNLINTPWAHFLCR